MSQIIPIGHTSKFWIYLSFHTHLGRQKSTRFIRLLDFVNAMFIYTVKFSGNKLSSSKTENSQIFSCFINKFYIYSKNKSFKSLIQMQTHKMYHFFFNKGMVCLYSRLINQVIRSFKTKMHKFSVKYL